MGVVELGRETEREVVWSSVNAAPGVCVCGPMSPSILTLSVHSQNRRPVTTFDVMCVCDVCVCDG